MTMRLILPCLSMLCGLLLLLSSCSPAQAELGIARWQGLPAIDVQHLQGAYASRRVCPMCQHGYDAGLMVFLPGNVSPEQTAAIAQAMRAVAAPLGPRFRAFLVFAKRPTAAALAASIGEEANWYVGYLPPNDLLDAERDYQFPLAQRAVGFVFAQRRVISQFDPLRFSDTAADAQYAIQFLREHYPTEGAAKLSETVASTADDHQAPQGTLWLAPANLSATLSGSTATLHRALCLLDERQAPIAQSLVSAIAINSKGCASNQRVCRTPMRWALSDDQGCFSVDANIKTLDLSVDQHLRPQRRLRVDTTDDLRQTLRFDMLGQLTNANLKIVGTPCEGCELALVGMPQQIPSTTRIAPKNEPGTALVLHGQVTFQSGKPASGIVIYAYQTDAKGQYRDASRLTRHSRLRAWAQTDANGNYRFLTIRPGAYPDGSEPQHIHLHVIEPNRCTYYIGDVLFADDPKLSQAKIAVEQQARGGSGMVLPVRDQQGRWLAQRDIVLGLQVPGYQACMP